MNIFQKYLSYGLSVIPCEMKRPLISWKPYQTAPEAVQGAERWKATQIALVCGKVSGGLVCIDFDTKNGDKYNPWLILINEQYPELLSKLVIEQSPSGGFHVIFKTEYQIGNVKLANNRENKATIETRGEGGYFVCAPSPNYVLQYGSFDNIQKLTNEETEIIINAAKSFNEKITESTKENDVSKDSTITGLTPFDDYNQRHDVTDILQKHGWKLLFERNGAKYFQRPGKEGRGISATWNVIPNRFYVFTTSTCFENMHIYKASAVYALLECSGDYSAAAKDLYAKGYGERAKPTNKQSPEKPVEVKLIDSNAVRDKIFDIIKKGYPKGKTTGWPSLDALYSIIKGQVTVITGMPSHGKSEFMDALAMNLVTKDRWKIAVFSPENYPVEMHYHKLIEKLNGKGLRDLKDEEIELSIKAISEFFFFIDALEEDISLDSILTQTEILIKEKGIDGLVIDPWNEIELSKPKDINDSDFIGVCLRRLRKFARRWNIHLWIVAHPTKMQKDKNGVYPIPELYDIQGSSHWRNKADNGICVHRDFENNTTQIHVQKIKFRYAGKQGMVVFKYREKDGNYEEVDKSTIDYSENRF
jgi:KaiC/GvpD/RAD55 family RecA-like ATPase